MGPNLPWSQGLTSALVLAISASAAHADPFAVLRDPKLVWHYEVVKGASLATLKPVANAPVATCHVTAGRTDDVETATIECTSDATPPPGSESFGGMLGMALYQSLVFAFDADGIHQVYTGLDAAQLKDVSMSRGFTFPRELVYDRGKRTKSWTRVTEHHDGGTNTVVVTERNVTIAGKSRPVWFSSVHDTVPPYPSPRDAASKRPGAWEAAFAPDVGPYLLCKPDPFHEDPPWCLRLVKVETTN